jgi:hypothetical protein
MDFVELVVAAAGLCRDGERRRNDPAFVLASLVIPVNVFSEALH